MSDVKLAAKLPAADTNRNGLIAAADQLVDRPHNEIYAIVTLTNAVTQTDHARGDARIPTAVVNRIEVVRGVDATVLEYMLDTVYTRRTGKAGLFTNEEIEQRRARLRNQLRDMLLYGSIVTVADLEDIVAEHRGQQLRKQQKDLAQDLSQQPEEKTNPSDDVPF
jgi:hypothetical protein